MLCAIITRYERKDDARMAIGDEQDTIEVMATVKAECPPHLLKFAGYARDAAGYFCTIHRCDKCGQKEWIRMPEVRR